MKETLRSLYEKRYRLHEEMEKLALEAADESNEITQADLDRMEDISKRYDAIDEMISRLERGEAEDAKALAEAEKFASYVKPSRSRKKLAEGGDELRFLDTETGREVRALRHDERISAGPEDLSIGRTIHSLLTGGEEYRAAVGGVDSSGGYLLNPQQSARVVDLARSASVVLRAGARTIPMATSEMKIARISSDATAVWRSELEDITSSDIGLGALTLQAKTVAALVYCSVELLEDAQNAPQAIENALRSMLAQALDQGILRGSGASGEIVGILSADDVDEQSSVGTPTNYAEVSAGIKAILTANYPGLVSGLSWILHPRDGATYDGLTASDNQPLQPTPWASQLQKLFTTALPTTDGGGSNESSMIVGDFRQVLIGMRTRGVRLEVLREGTDGTRNATTQLARWLRCYVRADAALLQPTWFSKLTGVTA